MDDRWNTTSVAETHGDTIRSQVRILTIILIALVIGQLAFAGVVTFGFGAWNAPPKGMLLSAIAAGFALQMFAMALFVPAFAQKAGLKKAAGNVDAILPVYQVKTILAAAFLEGGGFLNLVAFMLEHNKWTLVPVGLGILFILSLIPSEMRITHWADEAHRTQTNE